MIPIIFIIIKNINTTSGGSETVYARRKSYRMIIIHIMPKFVNNTDFLFVLRKCSKAIAIYEKMCYTDKCKYIYGG